jgi:hypothetical protein
VLQAPPPTNEQLPQAILLQPPKETASFPAAVLPTPHLIVELVPVPATIMPPPPPPPACKQSLPVESILTLQPHPPQAQKSWTVKLLAVNVQLFKAFILQPNFDYKNNKSYKEKIEEYNKETKLYSKHTYN